MNESVTVHKIIRTLCSACRKRVTAAQPGMIQQYYVHVRLNVIPFECYVLMKQTGCIGPVTTYKAYDNVTATAAVPVVTVPPSLCLSPLLSPPLSPIDYLMNIKT
ncbi:hypothetical protein J6590_093993 [Homalodisca vitripennis]|nr:hypothetical protein J6590_093993 [Homalodisca vitripennis]